MFGGEKRHLVYEVTPGFFHVLIYGMIELTFITLPDNCYTQLTDWGHQFNLHQVHHVLFVREKKKKYRISKHNKFQMNIPQRIQQRECWNLNFAQTQETKNSIKAASGTIPS